MKKTRKTLMMISSFYMMLLMGTVYSYSIFRSEIKSIFDLNTLSSGIPYMLSLTFYALSMMITGRFMKAYGLKYMLLIGTLLIFTGFYIASQATSFIAFSFGYGFLVGYGVGIVYGIPIYIIQHVYPKRRGFYTGLILLGFGLSPLLTAPLGNLLLLKYWINQTFLIFSFIFLSTQLPLSFLFKTNLDIRDANSNPSKIKYDKKFFTIYLLFMLMTTIGLMMIGLSYQVGVTYYGFNTKKVVLSLSIFALFNGLARPLFGYLIDKYGLIKPSFLSISLLIISSVIGIFNHGSNFNLYLISYSLFWFNLGAWLSIMPSLIKTYYDINLYSRVYGLIFTAYGIGAILSTLISGSILDMMGSTIYIYIAIMMMTLLAFKLINILKKF